MKRWITLSLLSLISSVSMANPCALISPVKLKPSELSQVQQKGYEVVVKRSLFERQRFLGIYEYYEMKHPEQIVGQIYLNAVLSPRPLQRNSFGPDVTLVSKREFHFMSSTARYQSTVSILKSLPGRLAANASELENADFSSLPACR